ncbi:hypothetical protein QE152_g22839 [Popillia japonica]|uniref:Uncharacterized protein n=1 Tax=Popillia japonica TaxID=7064 RepID=A0AAW1KJD0_POPJA
MDSKHPRYPDFGFLRRSRFYHSSPLSLLLYGGEIQNILDILTSAFFAVPAFIILVLCLYYFTAVNSANRHMVRILKDQLIQNILDILTSAFFAVPAFIILVLCLYYFTAVNSANRHMVRILKDQLVLEGHDKQFLLERLSLFIKQQQDAQKQLRRSEGDRNAASN